ncbi:TPA: EAL domain-containing protein [Legionella pneumophila]|nr:EAL domain-containing protein [Legionella pneumophila]HCW6768426.1 EAL domain-containing protein [Legionella pneumophila]
MKNISLWLYASIIFSGLTIVFGGSVLAGWHLGITLLLQYQYATIAMVYNTALSFTVLGLCIILLLFHYYKISQFLTTLIITLSFLVLLQTIFDINLHVDEFFLKHYYNVANYFPGRMAPNTTVSFIMAGVVIFIIGRAHWTFNMGVLASVFTILLLFMSLLFASGYVSSLQDAYEWSQLTPMALNTALGFILLSLSLLFALLYRCQYHGMSVWPAMPVILGLGMFLINSLLALSVHKQQYTSQIHSLLPYVIFILGTIFTLLFTVLLYYVQLERRHSRDEQKLRALTEATLDATADGIIAWNNKGIITHFNHKFSEFWRLSEEKIKGQNILYLLADMCNEAENEKSFRENMNTLIQLSQNHNKMTLKLKGNRFLEAHIQTKKTQGLPLVQVLSFHDISDAKNLEKDILHRNTHDLLTGLPNKALIMDLLDMAIQGVLHSKYQVGVFIIDISKFTQVNDVFGRSKGDELIRIIAEKLKTGIGKLGTLCRLGGDEFVVIASLNHYSEGQKLINNVLSALKPSIEFYDSQLNITCSIGVSICPQDGIQADELLRCADIAMIRAKKQGRNSFMYYARELGAYTYERMLLENELYIALDKNEFELYFQPLIELKTNKIYGFEALLRWKNPRLGLLTPDKFLPSAEDLGLMNDIGTWVVNDACHQLNYWRQQGLPLVKMSINVTAHQFNNNRLPDDINKALLRYDLPSECLEIELTEQVLIEGAKEVFNILSQLKEKKITIALDDFGTGYSSLSYIKKFPLDKLKIDQSFIRDLLQNEDNKNLLKAIIHLTESMRLSVLSEGIENQEQLDFLIANRCIYGQGFYFAKPMPSSECLNFIKKYKPGVIRDIRGNLKNF